MLLTGEFEEQFEEQLAQGVGVGVLLVDAGEGGGEVVGGLGEDLVIGARYMRRGAVKEDVVTVLLDGGPDGVRPVPASPARWPG